MTLDKTCLGLAAVMFTAAQVSFSAFGAPAGSPAEPKLPAAADSATYQNPLLPDIEMADPHVIKVGQTYYLYATTHTLAYEVFTSSNLVHWVRQTEVFPDPRRGLWAPDVFHDKAGSGKFYLYYTANGQFPVKPGTVKVIGVAESDSPLGPFTDKGVLASPAIDGHLYADGTNYYFYYADLKGGFKIMAQQMANPVEKKGEPVEVIRPTEPWETKKGHVTEGPFVLKHGSTYYLTYSGCGAESPDYGIGFATSTSPMGPFKKYENNPIVRRTDTVFGPGHHSIVEGPDNNLWLVYHQKWNTNMNYVRFLALDKIRFNDKGVLEAEPTRGVRKPIPGSSGKN